MDRKKAIAMLDRILDEDTDWTDDARRSLEMGIYAIKITMLIDRIRCIMCAGLFIVGLIFLTAVDFNDRVTIYGLVCLLGAALLGGMEDG